METHDDTDPFFRFEEGEGTVVTDDIDHAVKDGSGVIVPSGSMHNVTNTSNTDDLKLYTIYSPPHHRDKVVRKTRADALAKDEEFDGTGPVGMFLIHLSFLAFCKGSSIIFC